MCRIEAALHCQENSTVAGFSALFCASKHGPTPCFNTNAILPAYEYSPLVQGALHVFYMRTNVVKMAVSELSKTKLNSCSRSNLRKGEQLQTCLQGRYAIEPHEMLPYLQRILQNYDEGIFKPKSILQKYLHKPPLVLYYEDIEVRHTNIYGYKHALAPKPSFPSE